MSTLVVNLPSIDVWVRKEYLRDGEDGHGEFVKGVWVTAKSIPGRAFYFETYLPDYGALYDKLPISAFTVEPQTPTPDMDLYNLQFWNCMDYGVVAVSKQFIGSMDFEVVYKRSWYCKRILCYALLIIITKDIDAIDYSTSEKPAEHKSFNLLELENNQFCLYPNNRMRVYDNSLTPDKPLQPDFKVSTEIYQVENGQKFRLGDTDEYFLEGKR